MCVHVCRRARLVPSLCFCNTVLILPYVTSEEGPVSSTLTDPESECIGIHNPNTLFVVPWCSRQLRKITY